MRYWQLRDMEYPNFYAYDLISNGRELNWEEKRDFINNINSLFQSRSQIIYRGESKARLLNTYQSHSLNEFNDKFFIIGPKGNAFQREHAERIRIEDRKTSTFEVIFDWLHEMFDDNTEFERIGNVVRKFKSKNVEFVRYFSSQDNKVDFLERIQNLDQTGQVKARDYYLTLLHHNGESDFYSRSFLLSVSKLFGKAKQFAGNRNERDDKIIVMGWVPREQENRILIFSRHARYLNSVEILTANGLPSYNNPLFVHQQEISLKGGLFVQYIVGYLFISNQSQEFHLNPAFISSEGDWIQNGLTVDQSNFVELINGTRLTGGYYNFGTDEYFEGYNRVL